MSQIHFYVPSYVEDELRRRAEAEGVSLSRLVADMVRRQVEPGWPEDFFARVVGGWSGPALERPPQGTLEQREEL